MKDITLTHISDPNHGWIEVPLQLVQEVGVAPIVTRWSYYSPKGRFAPEGMSGQPVVYLEEDCDATVFLRAAKAAGWKVTINHHYCAGNAFVRRLPGYKDPA